MKIYSFILLTAFILPIYFVTSENIFGDIRWHFPKQNTKTKVPWDNEKTSKINLLFSADEKFNCLLLGSSRATLMSTDQFNCFNLAFSASIGQISELVNYYEYYIEYFAKPAHLAIEIGEFNFQGPASGGTPDFIYKKERPRSWIDDYVSLHTLVQTRKIFENGSSYFKRSRIYNKNYEATFNTHRRLVFSTVAERYTEKEINCSKIALATKELSKDNLVYFTKLRDIHHGKLTAYLSPLSPDRILNLYYTGQLDTYLEIAFEMSEKSDSFYDFAIPGAIGLQGETYDGSHFSPDTNKILGEIIFNQAKVLNYGLNLKKENLQSYKLKYQTALQKIISTYNLRKRPCA